MNRIFLSLYICLFVVVYLHTNTHQNHIQIVISTKQDSLPFFVENDIDNVSDVDSPLQASNSDVDSPLQASNEVIMITTIYL